MLLSAIVSGNVALTTRWLNHSGGSQTIVCITITQMAWKTQISEPHPQSFWFSTSRVESYNFHFNMFPSDADANGPWTTISETLALKKMQPNKWINDKCCFHLEPALDQQWFIEHLIWAWSLLWWVLWRQVRYSAAIKELTIGVSNASSTKLCM